MSLDSFSTNGIFVGFSQIVRRVDVRWGAILVGWAVCRLSLSFSVALRGGAPLFGRYFSDRVAARVRESAGCDMPPTLAKGNQSRLEAPGVRKGPLVLLLSFPSRYSFV